MLKAHIVGNIGSDPEMKYTASGQPLLTFSVASNYRAKNLAGNWDDLTEWVRVTIFGQRAEKLAEMLKKGMKVYADGRLEARPWVDRQDAPRAGLEMIANDIEFMSSRTDGQPVTAGTRPTKRIEEANDLEDLPF